MHKTLHFHLKITKKPSLRRGTDAIPSGERVSSPHTPILLFSVNFNAGCLLSEWSFVWVAFCPGLAFSVVFCPVVFCHRIIARLAGVLCIPLRRILRASEWMQKTEMKM